MAFGEVAVRTPFIGFTLNAHRRETPTYGDPEVVEGVVFAPGNSSESGPTGYTIESDAEIYLPYSQAASEHDRWVIRDETWEADGIAARWRNPISGTEWGVVVQLRRVAG